MDIAAWLRGLGLEEYEPAFRDNRIDVDVLPELTEADLASLGIPLGPRKKILKAARVLRRGAPSPTGRKRAKVEASSAPGRDAERRNLTVLICDMVNSTVLANQLDPEQLREVMHPYLDVCSDVVDRFGGFVAKYTGDGLIAYFGYPAAQEDAAEHAVRASFLMIEAIRKLAPRPAVNLQARIGIATGLTVVGDLIGKGAARDEAVVGAAPALAARLQALAHPDVILISNATRRLVRGIFSLEDLGRHELKGFPQPQRVWRALGTLKAESRFAAARRDGQTGLIGRDAELALLLDRWGLARSGAGQLIMLSGEAGLGKSRLIDALRGRLTGEAHDVVLLQCSNYYRNSSFYPVIEWLDRAVPLAPEDTAEIRLVKLRAKFSLSTEALERLAELLSSSTALVDAPPDARVRKEELLAALVRRAELENLIKAFEVRKEQLLAALVRLLAGTASGRTRLLVLEDAHWSDASTLELVGRLAAQVAEHPVLLIVTFRPEYAVPWPLPAATAELALSRLEQRHCARLVAGLGEAEGLTPELQSQIVDKAEGVPLFLEELTKSVLELGLAADSEAGAKFQLAVPATLHDALMARLDRLASVKVIAQTAAALGREFSYRMLVLLRQESEIVGLLRIGALQQGHLGRVLARPTMIRRRMVAIELGTCRSGRIGGASGSVTLGKARSREERGGSRS